MLLLRMKQVTILTFFVLQDVVVLLCNQEALLTSLFAESKRETLLRDLFYLANITRDER